MKYTQNRCEHKISELSAKKKRAPQDTCLDCNLIKHEERKQEGVRNEAGRGVGPQQGQMQGQILSAVWGGRRLGHRVGCIFTSDGRAPRGMAQDFRVPKTYLSEMDVLLDFLSLCYKHNFLCSISMPTKKSLVRIWVLKISLPSVKRMSDFQTLRQGPEARGCL